MPALELHNLWVVQLWVRYLMIMMVMAMAMMMMAMMRMATTIMVMSIIPSGQRRISSAEGSLRDASPLPEPSV